MIVTIIPIEDQSKYSVNGKTIAMHTQFGWMSFIELTKVERLAFQRYRELIIDNTRFKTHPKSTFKTH
ncbi:hypothetical protein [Flavobacterium gelatinilyticum]|uniref:hypothetical protein n=1 Tax=Flavobacterium gelatinilyticum TaxID=3003260 RepID=UPI0024802FEA|nr:hypothetical protein [Flavobacterium gelatinilyticum]